MYSKHIRVTRDGTVVGQPTGSTTFEYDLYFDAPNVGEYEDHTVTVLAWDDAGNSSFKSYTVTFHFIDEGDVTGTATIVLDATTVGLGILDTCTVQIRQGVPASQQVLDALEAYGYEASYDGTVNVGFYLRRISRGGMADNAAVPDNLWAIILRDGIQTNASQHYRDSLGEYDYTMGSGWMYSINGGTYAGRGLSSYYLTDGDTLYLRFTLAYGKDIGGSDSNHGHFSGYCGEWINGGYIQLSHDYVETSRVEPTETEDGYIEYTCAICGDTYREVLPATGVSPTPAEPTPTPTPVEPTPTPVEPTPTPSEPMPTPAEPTPTPAVPTEEPTSETQQEANSP